MVFLKRNDIEKYIIKHYNISEIFRDENKPCNLILPPNTVTDFCFRYFF